MADPPIEETPPVVRARWLLPEVVVALIPAAAGPSLHPMVANRLRWSAIAASSRSLLSKSAQQSGLSPAAGLMVATSTVPWPRARCSPCRKEAPRLCRVCHVTGIGAS